MVSFLEMNKLMDNNVRDENAGKEDKEGERTGGSITR